MNKRFEAARAMGGGACDWLVREFQPDRMSASIRCYCYGEAVAKQIADALNGPVDTRPKWEWIGP